MSIYLVAAYAVFWTFTSIFVARLWARQRRIEKDIQALEEQLQQKESTD